uniref:Uncharacterized protein n=1 Tax=Lates calcarifer TaxID=8187 RepID=A0A4W6CBI5_LATCA
MPHTICYLHNLVFKNRRVSASDLAQGLSVETVTDHTVRGTLYKVYEQEHEKKPDECWQYILWRVIYQNYITQAHC